MLTYNQARPPGILPGTETLMSSVPSMVLGSASRALPRFALATLLGLLAAAMGAMVPSHPSLAVIPALAVMAVMIVVNPFSRLLFLVAGGVLVLNSTVVDSEPGQILSAKSLYLAGVLLAFGIALLRRPLLRQTQAYVVMRPVLRASQLFGGYITFEMVRATLSGVDPLLVLRDGASYLLFAAVPLLAIDIATSGVLHSRISKLFVATASVGTISYVARFVRSRALASLGALPLGGLLPGALISYTFAHTKDNASVGL